jgi:rhamnulokinase
LKSRHFLAFDLGAESGRAVLGSLYRLRLSLRELLRFSNEPVQIRGTLYWDVLALYNNMLKAMRACSQRQRQRIEGIGVDGWGVDFALLGADGALLENPVHYRDRRTEGVLEQIQARIPPETLFRVTGMPLWQIQSACQLLSLRLNRCKLLESADGLLMFPDLLSYFLTGERICERTNAINTQLYDVHAGTWWREGFDALDLPFRIMPPLVDPGTTVGPLNAAVATEAGLDRIPVIAPCTHDTASAVAAVPASGTNWCFISSGTWSVVGALSQQVIPEACSAGLCNELTLGGPFLCRNITGLWVLQQVRRQWERQGATYDYGRLVELAKNAPAGQALVNLDDPCFVSPKDMETAIRNYCSRTGQTPPEGPGAIARCILESLALLYRRSTEEISGFQRRQFDVLHLVGGGSRNSLLCQFTANATRLPVVAGPSEATVAGNVLVQALAAGILESPQDIRDCVRRSLPLADYVPKDRDFWEDRYARFLDVVCRTRNS